MLTGWAVDANCRFRYQTDAAFPLSDHADFDELIELVKRVAPTRVYTLHGFAADFAQTLRGLGLDSCALSEEEQLALPLAAESSRFQVAGSRLAAPATPEPATGILQSGTDSFYRFAATCAAIGGVSGKLEKVRLLAGYLGKLDGEALGWVTTWFTGCPFAP